MAKNSFVADVTFKTCPQKSNKIIILDRENLLTVKGMSSFYEKNSSKKHAPYLLVVCR